MERERVRHKPGSVPFMTIAMNGAVIYLGPLLPEASSGSS